MLFRRKRSRYPKSEKLFAAASRILPGGVDSPVRAFKSVGATPLFMVRGSGPQIEDADGHTYIDYVMSWGPLIHGHAPKGLLKALIGAAARGTSFGAPTELETRLAQRVAMLMPSMERVRFVSSGTEAAMSAARVARARRSATASSSSRAATTATPTPSSPRRGRARRRWACRRARGYRRRGARHAARALQRPRLGRALSRQPRRGRRHLRRADRRQHGPRAPGGRLPRGAAALCDREGALLIFDEVISGFRASPGGAQKVYGVRPDLTCLGKIIGGGLPVGAYGGRRA
jgi:glutamate-1-semialdehyde 2,1-aminomutase